MNYVKHNIRYGGLYAFFYYYIQVNELFQFFNYDMI